MCFALASQRDFWHSQMFALQIWPPATKKLRLALPSLFPMSPHVLGFPLPARLRGCSQLPGV